MSLVRQIRKRMFMTEQMREFATDHTNAFPGMNRGVRRKVIRDSMKDLWREARRISGVRHGRLTHGSAAAGNPAACGISGVGDLGKAKNLQEKINALAEFHARKTGAEINRPGIFSRAFQRLRKSFTRNQTKGIGA